MKFVDPKTDIAFKKIFSNEAHKEILMEFLNETLILESPIIELQVLNPYQVPKLYDLKTTSLDIKAKDQLEREFLIEMQVAKEDWFLQRALYYSSKSYSQQLKIGGNYQELKPVIFLGILNFDAFEQTHYFSRHAILDVETQQRHFHDLEFNFIELKKFNKQEHELETIAEKWIYFLKQATNLDHVPENLNTDALKMAYQIAEQHQWSRDELEIYEAQEMDVHKHNNIVQTAKNEGLAEGRAEGLAEGIEQGLAQGKEKGEKLKALEIAKNLLTTGLDIETIAKATALTPAEIENLHNNED